MTKEELLQLVQSGYVEMHTFSNDGRIGVLLSGPDIIYSEPLLEAIKACQGDLYVLLQRNHTDVCAAPDAHRSSWRQTEDFMGEFTCCDLCADIRSARRANFTPSDSAITTDFQAKREE